MLDGRWFAIFTDHKPLTYALARVTEPWTARQTRQLSYVAEYSIPRTSDTSPGKPTGWPGHAAAERPPSVVTCV
jgi:hypothetical protein